MVHPILTEARNVKLKLMSAYKELIVVIIRHNEFQQDGRENFYYIKQTILYCGEFKCIAYET